MSMTIDAAAICQWQEQALVDWYRQAPDSMAPGDDLRSRVLAQHFCNFSLWNHEDEARRRDVPDSYIADTKRAIDGWNQRRNDLIEQLDVAMLAQLPEVDAQSARQNSETAGSMIDRMSILALKVHHMGINAARKDDPELAQSCAAKLEVLKLQRGDLARCLEQLVADFQSGQRYFRLYRQYKAYNDPRLNPALYKHAAQGQ